MTKKPARISNMKNKKLVIIFVGILIILSAIFLIRIFSGEDDWICENGSWIKHGNPSSDIPSESCGVIGGQRDEHGCLGAAGYSWNETEKECVREWEKAEGRYQVMNFQNCVDAGYPILESSPRKCETQSGRIFEE